jgi:ATP-binding cassette, subfamily B, bacterial
MSGFFGWLARLIPPFAPVETPPPTTIKPFVLWCLKGSGPALIFGSVVAILAGIVEIMSAILLGDVIDAALEAGPGEVFQTHVWLLVGVALFQIIARPLLIGASAAIQAITVGPAVNVLVQSRLHRWTLGQAVTFFDNDFAGRIAQKQMQASRALTDVVVEFLNTIVFALASVIATAFLVVSIDWRVAVVLLVWLAGYLTFIRYFLPRLKERAEERAASRSMVTGQIVDTITNMRTVKLFAHTRLEDDKAIEVLDDYRERTLEFGITATWFRIYLMIIAGMLPILMVGVTLWFWTEGAATTGDIAATGTVALRIAQMTGWVSFSLMTMYANIGEVEDGMHTLSAAHTLTDAPDAQPLVQAGEIHFDNVTFAYGRKKGGVQGINLVLAPGEKIGLVGASGAGKSSLVSLMLRLYDPEVGKITIAGQDIAHVTQESLRRAIGMVTQETAMFNRTARDNILYGRPEASEDELFAAARRASAHEFILGLQDHRGRKGYEAFLGERGVKLSGGQRQRIALARAILKDAPILVLDEATSALDSEVEAEIQAALEEVMQGKTVLAIAHRLSTIARMDRIVVMDQGRIVEMGTHDELLKQGGFYARYWNRQSGGFLGTDEDEAAAAE